MFSPNLKRAVLLFLEAYGQRYALRWRTASTSWVETELEGSISQAFVGQGKILVKYLAPYAGTFPEDTVIAEAKISDKDWEAILAKVFGITKKSFLSPINKAVKRAFKAGTERRITGMEGVVDFNLENPRAKEFISNYGASKITDIEQTTKDELRRLLVQAMDSRWSYQTTAKAIISKFDEFAVGKPQMHIDSRAHLVAVTETANAYSEGTHQAALELMDAGLEMEHFWLNVGDDRVSDGCRANTAVGWIPLTQLFPSGHIRTPRFPGCRCDTLTRRKPDVGE